MHNLKLLRCLGKLEVRVHSLKYKNSIALFHFLVNFSRQAITLGYETAEEPSGPRENIIITAKDASDVLHLFGLSQEGRRTSLHNRRTAKRKSINLCHHWASKAKFMCWNGNKIICAIGWININWRMFIGLRLFGVWCWIAGQQKYKHNSMTSNTQEGDGACHLQLQLSVLTTRFLNQRCF